MASFFELRFSAPMRPGPRLYATLAVMATIVSFAAFAQEEETPPENPAPEIETSETPPQAESATAPTRVTPAAPSDTPQTLKPRRRPVQNRTAPQKRPPQGSGEYQLPLRFDPEDNGLSIDNPQLKYLMVNENKIDLGGMKLESEMIGFTLDQMDRDKVPVRFEDRTKTSKYVTSISFRWPSALSETGEVTLETFKERVLWKKTIEDKERKKWKESLEYFTQDMTKAHAASQWGDIDIPRETFPFLYRGAKFRMCFNKTLSETEKLRICSRPYEARASGEKLEVRPLKTKNPANAGVFLGGSELENSGLINFNIGKIAEIKIVFGDYSYIRVASQPLDPRLLDVVESADGSEILLTGAGVKPLTGRPRILARPITHFWAPTGIDQDLIWQIAIRRQSPTIRIRGSFNVPMTLYFAGERLPKESDRVFLYKFRSSGTYSASPRVPGYIPSGGTVSSQEYSAGKTDDHHFDWSFAAPKKGEKNRARLLIQNESGAEKPWVAHYELFRSYPYELSTRLTGILASDFTFIIMGEAQASAWFENLAFSHDPRWSRQRWGLSAKYFKSLTSIDSDTGTKIENYAMINADLKYNILAGIWHRDEIVGVMLNLQQTTLTGPKLGNHVVQFLGLGAYWARTMPKVVNDVFNILPFMNYPKYVDMEFSYMPLSLTSGYGSGATFNLNFHGRVFWSERLYGEAGFGMRQSDFNYKRANGSTAAIAFGTGYGTFGLGYRF